MSDAFKFPKDNGLSHYGGQDVLRDVHNEKNKALDVLIGNHLVPSKYSRLEIDYLQQGINTGEIKTVRYFSDGIKQKTWMKCEPDIIGSPHKTSLLFSNLTSNTLAKTFFVIYDDQGSVAVFYKLSGEGKPPSNFNRNIIIDLQPGDSLFECVIKTATALNNDDKFNAIHSSEVIIISCVDNGPKQVSVAGNSPIFLTNTIGAIPNRLIGKWFYINSAEDAEQYYFYTSIDPQIQGKIGIKLNIPEGATDISVATQIKNSLEATGKFIVEQSDNELLIINKLVGPCTEANANNTPFKMNITEKGSARQLVTTLNIEYNETNDVISVERE